MKIVFMGTPKFAVPSLNILLDNHYEIPFVVTVPDKEKGRGLKKQFSDIKIFALEKNIPVLQPESLKYDDNFKIALKAANPDLIVIIAFSILPRDVYTLPKFGSINLHASYLPKYRGAAPINRAIMNGEKETGLTTFFLKDKEDTGNIILRVRVPIYDEDNAGTLHNRLSIRGAELLLESIRLIESGDYSPLEQDDSIATKAPKIFKNDCLIDWSNPALSIHNQIRGLSPYPAAYTYLNSKICKIFTSKITDFNSETEPGIIKIENKRFFVSTGTNMLEIFDIQMEGKKRISIADFLNGINKNSLLKFN